MLPFFSLSTVAFALAVGNTYPGGHIGSPLTPRRRRRSGILAFPGWNTPGTEIKAACPSCPQKSVLLALESVVPQPHYSPRTPIVWASGHNECVKKVKIQIFHPAWPGNVSSLHSQVLTRDLGPSSAPGACWLCRGPARLYADHQKFDFHCVGSL